MLKQDINFDAIYDLNFGTFETTAQAETAITTYDQGPCFGGRSISDNSEVSEARHQIAKAMKEALFIHIEEIRAHRQTITKLKG